MPLLTTLRGKKPRQLTYRLWWNSR